MSGRGITFTLQEQETLVELWADVEIQKKFNSMVHNGKIWDDLAKEFNMIYPDKLRTGVQLKNKIKALKKWYRDYKKGQGKSGAAGDKDDLWDLMDRVEGGKELTRPSHTGDTLILSQDKEEEADASTSSNEHDEDIESSRSSMYEDDDIDGDAELIEEEKRRKVAAPSRKRTRQVEPDDIAESIMDQIKLSKKPTVKDKALMTAKRLDMQAGGSTTSSEDWDEQEAQIYSDDSDLEVPKPYAASTPKAANTSAKGKQKKLIKPRAARPGNRPRPNQLDKMEQLFTQMGQQQQQQQAEMLQSLQKMQADMVRQQLEAEEKAQKSAQDHELRIMQLLMRQPAAPQPPPQVAATQPPPQAVQQQQRRQNFYHQPQPQRPHQQQTSIGHHQAASWPHQAPQDSDRNVFVTALSQSMNTRLV